MANQIWTTGCIHAEQGQARPGEIRAQRRRFVIEAMQGLMTIVTSPYKALLNILLLIW